MNTIFKTAGACLALLLCGSADASAQGFLKKVSKGISKVTSTVEKTADTVSEITGTSTATENTDDANDDVKSINWDDANDDVKSINWEAIPHYTLQKVYLVDDAGNNLLNEDGTQQYNVYLIDQYGKCRNEKAVRKQNRTILLRCTNMLAKLTATTAAGAKGGGVGGALLGAGAGLLASAGDIKMMKKQIEALKEQKKLIEFYSQNFTDEGAPKDANIDIKKETGIDFNESNTVSQTTAQIKEMLASDSFSTTPPDDWDRGGDTSSES